MYKAINRIPLWAANPTQINHKIMRAFLLLEKKGSVAIESLKQYCSNHEVHPDTYVEKFRGNFASMKSDRGNAHGKVFIEENGWVKIWEPIKDTVRQYKSSFIG
jgi:hypothetical protein